MNAISSIRRLDTRKDLSQIADLIEECFRSTLDEDGNNYLHQVRRAAGNPSLVQWSTVAGESVSYPLNGFVWEEDGKVIGNLSLIPFFWNREWGFLIANVAVDAAFRQQGIAKKLTQRAIEYLKAIHISNVWLHVRVENQIARHLYETFGFRERCIRDTWLCSSASALHELPKGIVITRRKKKHWRLQAAWLSENYPPEVAWHFSFSLQRFAAGVWPSIVRFFYEQQMQHWTLTHDSKPIGFVSWEPGTMSADPLWLAASHESEGQVIRCMLPYLKASFFSKRPVSINYPAGRAHTAFEEAGFERLSTLSWMNLKLI